MCVICVYIYQCIFIVLDIVLLHYRFVVVVTPGAKLVSFGNVSNIILIVNDK